MTLTFSTPLRWLKGCYINIAKLMLIISYMVIITSNMNFRASLVLYMSKKIHDSVKLASHVTPYRTFFFNFLWVDIVCHVPCNFWKPLICHHYKVAIHDYTKILTDKIWMAIQSYIQKYMVLKYVKAWPASFVYFFVGSDKSSKQWKCFWYWLSTLGDAICIALWEGEPCSVDAAF